MMITLVKKQNLVTVCEFKLVVSMQRFTTDRWPSNPKKVFIRVGVDQKITTLFTENQRNKSNVTM